jgi:hypothetical protein
VATTRLSVLKAMALRTWGLKPRIVGAGVDADQPGVGHQAEDPVDHADGCVFDHLAVAGVEDAAREQKTGGIHGIGVHIPGAASAVAHGGSGAASGLGHQQAFAGGEDQHEQR